MLGCSGAPPPARSIAPSRASPIEQLPKPRSRHPARLVFRWTTPGHLEAELRDHLQIRRGETLRRETLAWEESIARLPDNCASCINYQYTHDWRQAWKVADLQVLVEERTRETGGAHATEQRSVLLWDTRSAEAVEPLELFADPAVLQEQFCDALAQELPTAPCPPIDTPGVAVMPASTGVSAIESVRVEISPGIVASFAVGPVPIEVEVDARLFESTAPAYRDRFAPSELADLETSPQPR